MLAPAKLDPVLQIEGLAKTFYPGRWWEKRFEVHALRGINLRLLRGKTLSLIGKSGSGKTTLAMCVALLERPSSGEIWFNGQPMSSLTKAEYVLLRPKVQIIFQDSAAALPARFTAAQIIEEPLTIQGHHSIDERSRLTLELMAKVGLSPAWSNRLPSQLSGGQRQRLAIARSLVLRPDVLVLDEPFTGLDLSVRNQIVNLLLEIQAELELTYLYISHDLELVRYFSDSVALIHEGEIVENANVTDLFSSPRHAVTRALLGSKGSALRSSRSRLVQ